MSPSVFPRRFVASKLKHTTPASKTCDVSKSTATSPPSRTTSSLVVSFTRHSSSCTSFAAARSASSPFSASSGPVLHPSSSGTDGRGSVRAKDVGAESKGVRSGVERRRGASGSKARGDGRTETPAGRESPQGTAFTTRMGSYGDQCEENAPETPPSGSRLYRRGCRRVTQSQTSRNTVSAARDAPDASSHAAHRGSASTSACFFRISRVQSRESESCSNQSDAASSGLRPVPRVRPREAHRNRPAVATFARSNRSIGNGDRRAAAASGAVEGGEDGGGGGDDDDAGAVRRR